MGDGRERGSGAAPHRRVRFWCVTVGFLTDGVRARGVERLAVYLSITNNHGRLG